LCENFEWNAGKGCYTEKFGVVVPTPKPTPVPTPKPTPAPTVPIQFGMYGFQKSPGPGWVLINSLNELNKVKDQFVKFYNKNKGIPVIKSFEVGNCGWTFSSGRRINIGSSKYLIPYQGRQMCVANYRKGVYQFYVYPAKQHKADLTANTDFTEVIDNAADGNNPGIFRKTS